MSKKDEYIIFINNEYFVKTILTFEEDFHGIKATGMDIETSEDISKAKVFNDFRHVRAAVDVLNKGRYKLLNGEVKTSVISMRKGI